MSGAEVDDIDDIMTPEQAITELSILDDQIMKVRFDKMTTENEKMERLSTLMEERNALTDKLIKAKAQEFKDFIDSLDLGSIQCSPFYPVQRRCRIQTNNPDMARIEKPLPKKEFKDFFKKAPPVDPLTEENHKWVVGRLDNLKEEVKVLEKKKILSPQEVSHLLRLQAEITALEKFLSQ